MHYLYNAQNKYGFVLARPTKIYTYRYIHNIYTVPSPLSYIMCIYLYTHLYKREHVVFGNRKKGLPWRNELPTAAPLFVYCIMLGRIYNDDGAKRSIT